MSIFLVWVGFSIAVGFLADRYGRNGVGWFFLSLVCSPLLIGVILLALGPRPRVDIGTAPATFVPEGVLKGIFYRPTQEGRIEAMAPGGRIVFRDLNELAIFAAGGTIEADTENMIYLDTKDGRIVIKLRPDLAPKHAERLKTLVRERFYDNLPFHRVVDGFMAQVGDPGGSKYSNLPAEFSDVPFKRGVVGMRATSVT